MSILKSELSLEITRLKLQKVHHMRKEKKRSTEDMKKNPAWQKGLPSSNSAEQLGSGKNNNCIIVLK
jgi:hypothetical protein